MIEGVSPPEFELGDLVKVRLSAKTAGGRVIRQRVSAFIAAVHIHDLVPGEIIYYYTLVGRPDDSSQTLLELCDEIGFGKLDNIVYFDDEPWPESQIIAAQTRKSGAQGKSRKAKKKESPARALDL